MAQEKRYLWTNELRHLQIAVSSFVLLIALLHVVQPGLAIDSITLTLIVIAIAPWLAPFVKSIKLPGGAEITLNNFEKIDEGMEKTGLLAPKAVKVFKFRAAVKPPAPEYSFQTASNPNLALAGLRIELEKKLREIAEANNIPAEKASLSSLLFDLSSRNVITNEERRVMSNLAATLNRAVHGAEADESAADWAVAAGPRILEALGEKAKKAAK